MTLTEIYSKLVDSDAEVLAQRAEVRRLEAYLHQILEEIEAKSPALIKQRTDLEKAVRARAQLIANLETSTLEQVRLVRPSPLPYEQAHSTV